MNDLEGYQWDWGEAISQTTGYRKKGKGNGKVNEQVKERYQEDWDNILLIIVIVIVIYCFFIMLPIEPDREQHENILTNRRTKQRYIRLL